MAGIYYDIPGSVSVIGLSGKARSGKNYLARHALLPLGFYPLALANHFKVDAVVRDGAPINEVFFGAKSEATRDLLQQRGTEQGRHVFGEDIWIRTTEAWIAAGVAAGWSRFVLTDVRFTNEADWVNALGGLLVRVAGRGGLEGPLAQHPSETDLDTYTGPIEVLDNAPQRLGSAVQDLKGLALRHLFLHAGVA